MSTPNDSTDFTFLNRRRNAYYLDEWLAEVPDQWRAWVTVFNDSIHGSVERYWDDDSVIFDSLWLPEDTQRHITLEGAKHACEQMVRYGRDWHDLSDAEQAQVLAMLRGGAS